MDIIKETLLRNLVYLNKWGASHTSFDNLPKGFPGEMRGTVKKVARKLIKERLLVTKPTSYGLQVSLNLKKKKEIEEIAFKK